jgi:hypothetical protein
MINTPVPLSSNSETFDLLAYYSFDADRFPQAPTKIKVLDCWLKTYPESWVRLALIESLYQGRYKVFCVEQLLAHWHRRGYPVFHFNHEFEDLVCHDVPRNMGQSEISTQTIIPSPSMQKIPAQTEVDSASDLPLSEPLVELTETSFHEQESPLSSQNLELTGEAVQDLFEEPWGDTSGSGLPSMFNIQQMLPVTVGRLGLEPIHQFIPEAQPIEFCEKLDAIAQANA